MYDDAIRFSFPDAGSAYIAFDTLQELGYEPVIDGEEEKPTLHIHVERSDVRSALEIAQIHGGELLEASHPSGITGHADSVPAAHPGFDLNSIGIPAHTVTEDFPDTYMSGDSVAYVGDEAETLLDGYRDSVYE